MVESLGVSEELIAPLRDSSAGYFALTFALYKIATPLRYAVTVGKYGLDIHVNTSSYEISSKKYVFYLF